MLNPIEMGYENHDAVIKDLKAVKGYAKYFKEAFGTEEVSIERVTKAIADYERTRMSGNSPWDKWRKGGDTNAVSQEVKRGHELFFGNAFCNNCHLGQNFTDSKFHNLGVGWDAKTLREVLELYIKGGNRNPHLDRLVDQRFAEQLDLTESDITALIKFMEALDGEGYQDTAPASFPR